MTPAPVPGFPPPGPQPGKCEISPGGQEEEDLEIYCDDLGGAWVDIGYCECIAAETGTG